ncbi:MAG: Ig-like domain-containing protein [Saprospiraceae bacterium]
MNLRIALPFFALVGLAACAKIGSLQGGPKDEQPPQLDTARSTRNFATRFNARRIELTFDEWVQLSDVGTQVVISPPLATRPDITLKGKTVRVQLAENEQLRPNTTYTFNFGDAVKDFTEGNPAKDLRFVFSTGDQLDSLRVTGAVTDAFSGESVEKISVMLYDQLADSVPRRERPYYLTKTEKTGAFTIANVRAGTFKIVAIEDGNQNNKWDEGERIAFLAEPIVVADSVQQAHRLLISKELPTLRSVETSANRYGLAKIGFNTTPPADLRPVTGAPDIRLLTERVADTLLVWYDFPNETLVNPWELAVGRDTIRVKALNREEFLRSKKLAFADEVAPAKGARPARNAANRGQKPPANAAKIIPQNPWKPAALDFNFPITGVDTSKWLLLEDTTRTRTRSFSAIADSLLPRRLNLATAWKSDKKYALLLLPGALTDFFGSQNTDTLRRDFLVTSDKQFGGLNLTAKKLKPGTRYVLQLLNGTNMEEERVFTASSAEERLVFAHLPTATFTARLVEDLNGNGRWDPANYFAHQQPEPVFQKKLEALRVNWELEAEIEASIVSNKRGAKN